MQLIPPEYVFELICKRYFDKGNTREVNYVKFCKDVDKPEDMFEGQQLANQPADLAPGSRKTKSNFFGSSTMGMNIMDNRFS